MKSSSPTRGRMLWSGSTANSTRLDWGSGRSEAADHQLGKLHSLQALTLDIADQQPKAVAGHGHVVEVATDQGVLGGRQVAYGQGDPAHPGRDGAQDRPLRDLGDPGDAPQGPLPLDATVGDEGAQRSAGPHRQAAQQVVGGAKDAVGDAEQDREAERVQADDGGALGVEAGSGQQRADDQQTEQDRAATSPGVQERDGRGDHQGNWHRSALGLHRSLLANQRKAQRRLSDGRWPLSSCLHRYGQPCRQLEQRVGNTGQLQDRRAGATTT
jgi:hypothetical protein